VNQPRIMFLDEATSALDNHSQAVVSASMERMQATRVVIAHRLSTIINADRIYVLDKGRIVQAGSYEQLMRQEGLFAELAKRQMA
jgi:ABC-type multidrug transport system fused ATPase/permease subunit